MPEIKLEVQKMPVKETIDGGFKVSFSADKTQMLEVAKLLCLDQTQNIKLTVEYE